MKLQHLLSFAAVAAFSLMVVSDNFAEVPVVDASQDYTAVADNSANNAVEANQQITNLPAAQQPVGQSNNAYLMQKMQSMQQEIQDLRGQLEVTQHDLKMLRQQQQAFYQDLDTRVAQLKGTATIAMTKNTKAIPTPFTDLKPASTVVATLPVLNKPAINKAVPKNNPPAIANKVSAKQAYQQAYKLIQQKQFSAATTSMNTLLRDHPKSEYSGNAHYWLGELYLAQREMPSAIKEFNTVISDFPQSNKVAAAMLKLGFAYFDEGKLGDARKELVQVKQKFPQSSTAQLAQARLDLIDEQVIRN